MLFANFGAILENRIAFGPDIAVDDGVLDCCIFSPAQPAGRDADHVARHATRFSA